MALLLGCACSLTDLQGHSLSLLGNGQNLLKYVNHREGRTGRGEQ